MSEALLKQYISEVMSQSLIKKDPDSGKPIIRKLVKFKRSGSRFGVGDNVDTKIDKHGHVVVDDAEVWQPDFRKKPAPPKPSDVHRVA